MKVLMFGWEFPPIITGGLGTACFGLSQSLSQRVEKITFVIPKVKGHLSAGRVDVVGTNQISLEFDHETSFDSLDIFSVDAHLTPYITEEGYQEQIAKHLQMRSTESSGVLDFTGDYGINLFEEVIRYAKVVKFLVQNVNFDIIHAHDWLTFLAGIEAKRLTGKPFVAHVHALEFDRSGDHINQRIYDIERYGLHQADVIIAVSQRTKQTIVERYGIPAEKVRVVYNGIIRSQESEKSQRKKVLPGRLVVFLGRVTMQKGPEYFLEAAYLVSKMLDDVRFVMAGSGDMLPRIIARMAELRMLDRFHFTGFLSEKQRSDLFSMADLFVMTSVSEPYGLTPVEALEYNVPLIVTKQSGVAEVLTHAIKVDFWDVRKIADSIIKVLEEPGLSDSLKIGGCHDFQGICWNKSAEQIKNIYQEVAGW